ncbi:MAG: transcription elongation factor GreB [Desulfobacteraceae bacterium]|nr:MAG: transcription elongation factor GreB [Desulfobacteraceae bacterium]
MNKAFVKDDDTYEDPEIQLDPREGIPEGSRNYMTPQGARRLREELDRLVRDERPRLSAAVQEGDQGSVAFRERQKTVQRLEARIAFLSGRLILTEVIDPLGQKSAEVRFGATVTVLPEEGPEKVYRIVGIDEADVERGCISWTSPLARAMLETKAGDVIRVRTPAGEEELEIVDVCYREIGE